METIIHVESGKKGAKTHSRAWLRGTLRPSPADRQSLVASLGRRRGTFEQGRAYLAYVTAKGRQVAHLSTSSDKARSKRMRLVWLGGGAATLVLVIVGASAMLRPSRTIDPDKLSTVERGDIARSVVATGKIEPLTKVEVKSKSSGIVKKILVDEGQQVKAGQVLVELDKEQLRSAVAESSANLQAARSGLEAAEAAYQKNLVDAEGPDLPFLRRDMDRAHDLYKQGLIALNVMQDAEKNYQLALNRQVSAERNADMAKAQVAEAQAQIAQSKAALDNAEENLRYATITSPIDGEVLSKDVEVGDAVSSILVLGSQATLVMTLGDTSEVYVKGRVDESDIGRVYSGQRARIVVESFPDKTFEGRVTKISPLGVEKDNVTTFEVRVSIENPTGELRANMSANAEILLEEKKHALVVPEGALIFGKDKNVSVEVPDPRTDTGRRRVGVKVGISNGVKAEILAGLAEGEKVVLQ
jgi:HlyD family secretion protein